LIFSFVRIIVSDKNTAENVCGFGEYRIVPAGEKTRIPLSADAANLIAGNEELLVGEL
jgi:hypothetical protein